MNPIWQQIAHRKRTIRNSLIPSAWRLSSFPSPTTHNLLSIPRTSGILTPSELHITESYDATSLASALRSRSLTAEEVALAFCKRAAIAHQLCNCLTEIFFTEAIQRAKWLDAEFARTGNPVGLLHGVPISLKDTFNVKGFDACIGIAALAENPARENSILVDVLLEAGAVLYVKTNVPQTLMALDSDNHVWGGTLNPRDIRLTAGGSSGGEAALIAMRGSILGVGTDVGGSIRIPAMCNGLYGVKPSSGRVPFGGQETGLREGMHAVGLKASAGPLATTLRDCEMFLKVVAQAKPWERDPDVCYGVWEERGGVCGGGDDNLNGEGKEKGKENGKLKFGVLRTDGITTPLPPIAKILSETAQKLRDAGHEVVELDIPAFRKCQGLANRYFGIEGNNYILDLLEKTGEPLINWLRGRVRRKPVVSLEELVELSRRRGELENEVLWGRGGPDASAGDIGGDGIGSSGGRSIDAIICPVAPHPTPPIDRWNGVGYTSAFVLLDYACGVLPVRRCEEEDLKGVVEGDEDGVGGSWERENRKLWDSKSFDRNLYLASTLCVQVVAPKLQERRLIGAMRVLDGVWTGGESESKRVGKAKL